MTSPHPDDYTQFLEQMLELPPGSERDQLLESLRSETRGGASELYSQARQVLRAADMLWLDAHRAPDLKDDPLAAMLGLVPDDGYQVNPRSLKRAREAANIEPTELAQALTDRGWNVSTRDVFAWETKGAPSASPALLHAAADILGIDPDRLTRTTTRAAASQASKAVLVAKEAEDSPLFAKLVARFARLQGISEKMAGSALHSRMLATVQRGEHPDAEQMLASLQALIEALENPNTPS